MGMPKDADDGIFREEINHLDRNDAANDAFLARLEKYHPERNPKMSKPTDAHPTVLRTVRADMYAIYIRSSANYDR